MIENNSCPFDIQTAYAKGWEDACVLAIARMSPMTEVDYSADEAIVVLKRIAETGAHDPENQAGYGSSRLEPPDPTKDGEYMLTNNVGVYRFSWTARNQTGSPVSGIWHGNPQESGVEIGTPEGMSIYGFRLVDGKRL